MRDQRTEDLHAAIVALLAIGGVGASFGLSLVSEALGVLVLAGTVVSVLVLHAWLHVVLR